MAEVKSLCNMTTSHLEKYNQLTESALCKFCNHHLGEHSSPSSVFAVPSPENKSKKRRTQNLKQARAIRHVLASIDTKPNFGLVYMSEQNKQFREKAIQALKYQVENLNDDTTANKKISEW